MVEISEIKSEERLIPIIRAYLAERLVKQGFRAKEIASVLNVTRAAVTQYLKGKRGKEDSLVLNHVESILNPLSEKLAKNVRTGVGGLESGELLETARQLLVMNKSQLKSAPRKLQDAAERNIESLKVLSDRLQLELKAAEKYLELANRTTDERTKLLLRLIASDSIKHSDIVSQVISWLEIGEMEHQFGGPNHELLAQMVALEDSANEVNLRTSVKTKNPVAKLLLEWIDRDEDKHERIVRKILRLN